MSTLEFRPYRNGDGGAVKDLINGAFTIDRYLNDPRLVASGLEVYLRDCLLESSYAQVAVLDGVTVGVLMGRVKGERRLPGRIKSRLLLIVCVAKLFMLGRGNRDSVTQYLQFARVYRQMLNQEKMKPNNELTLFAVRAEARGHGIGQHLYHGFLDHLRANGADDYYLFTDTRCTYSFYDHQGMKQTASQNTEIRLDGKPETLGVFLYTGALTGMSSD